MKKKTLYISPGYNPVRKEPVQYMANEYGIDFVFVAKREIDPALDLSGGQKYYQFCLSGRRLSELSVQEAFALFVKLYRIIWKGNYDIILTSTQHSLHSKLAFFICKLLDKKFYVRVETWYDSQNTLFMHAYHKLSDFIVRGADGCLVNGVAAKKFLVKKKVASERIMIFPLTTGDPLTKIGNKLGMHKKKERIGLVFVGRLIKIKGVDVLINAFSVILLKYPALELTIIGSGPEKENLIQLCRDMKLEKSVTFIEWMNHEEVLNMMSEHQIFVLPSIEHEGQKEGFGLSLVEAAGLGLALVSTDAVGASYDFIQNGHNGYVVKNNSIDELAAAIEKVLPYWQKMGTNSRVIFEKYISGRSKVLEKIMCAG